MSAMHMHEQTIPRGALWFIAFAIVAVIVAALAVRLGFVPVAASPANVRAEARLVPLTTRDLSFVDRADGGLTITDVGTGRIARSFEPGVPSGFIRGLMRGLARERRMNGVGAAAPFRLESWPNGQLSLTDLATGRTIELTAFGPDNRAAFAALIR